MPDQEWDHSDRRHEVYVTNDMLWRELIYLRRKLDSLETKVLFMFGTVSAIGGAVAIFELLRPKI